jgi:hypothetical protein
LQILREIKNRQETIIFAFIGLMKRMMAYFEHNTSRIPHTINLDDYSDQELLAFLKQVG